MGRTRPAVPAIAGWNRQDRGVTVKGLWCHFEDMFEKTGKQKFGPVMIPFYHVIEMKANQYLLAPGLSGSLRC